MRLTILAPALAFGLAATAALAGQTTPNRSPQGSPGLEVREEWRRNVYGEDIGKAGLYVVDLDADGDVETVATGSARGGFWYVVSLDGDGYSQEWVSDEYRFPISSLRVVQADGDPQLEVVVLAGSRLTVYDGATKQVQTSWDGPWFILAPWRAFEVVDVDGDNALEVVSCTFFSTSALYVHDLGSGALEYQAPGVGCEDLAVGNVDNDPAVEIVLARQDMSGLVVDGSTHVVEWSNPAGFGRFVRLGDLDSDGRQEIVAADDNAGDPITIHDAELHALAGTVSVPYPMTVTALSVLDVEGDGLLEILYGDHDTLHVFDGQTQTLKWVASNPPWGAFSSPASNFTSIVVGNTDGDAARELLWGSGTGSSGPDFLAVFDTVTRVHEWQNLAFEGPFLGLAHGDIDGDGDPELLYASSKSDNGYGNGMWFVHDARTKRLEHVGTTPDGYIHRVVTGNVDGDPQQEVFVPADTSFFGAFVVCYDGASHAEQWRSASIGEGHVIASLQLGNVDGDAGQELVVSTRRDTSGSPGLSIYVLDAASGVLEWQSPILVFGGSMPYLRVGQVDGEPNVEIVVGESGGQVFVIDGMTHVIDDLGDLDVTGLDLHDRNGDGVNEIIIGTLAGNLRVVSTTGTIVETIGTYGGKLDGLRVLDVTGDGRADYVFCVGDEVIIRDGVTGTARWTSGLLRQQGDEVVGAEDSLLVADIDEDGRREILVNIGDIGLRLFEIVPQHDVSLTVNDAPDPVLVGDNVTYSWTVHNLTSLDASGVQLTVALPAAATFVSSTPGPPTCFASPGSVSCALGALPGGSSTLVSVVATVQATGQPQSTGTVSAAVLDLDPSNNTATATTTVTSTVEANLALSMDDGAGVVGPLSTRLYEIKLTNLGPWPVPGVTLNDTLPPTLLDATFTPTVGSYDPASGIWSGLDLGAGQVATLWLSATVSASASGALVNSAAVAPPAGVTDPLLANNTADDTDLVVSGLVELTHGASAMASVNGAGEHYYRLRQQPFSSYEVILDGVSGDLGSGVNPVRLERLGANLSILAEGISTGLGPSRSLRWENTDSAPRDGEAIRVRSADCTTNCGADDVFRIRAYDTTCDLVRFNNSGGQVTIVLIQNTGRDSVNGSVRFWSGTGALLATASFANVPARGMYTLVTPSIPDLAGVGGSLTVTSDAPYGTLVGKAVAVEPATGFTFDTPMRARPR